MSSPIWRAIQKENFRDWSSLIDFLEWEPALQKALHKTARFPLNLPKRLAEKIRKNTLDDPILRQFLPLVEETEAVAGFSVDPVADESFRKGKKLLHKYEGRALLVCTSACAMHCRYCFRQHFPYAKKESGFEAELALIREDPSLSEILLSGGDPLSLSNETLENLFRELASIPHLKRLRIHTRFPMGIPERIDPPLLDILASSRLQVFFVIHCNHKNELDETIGKALKEVQKRGIPLLNQTVLLRHVNDSVEALTELFSTLVDWGIIPYYLHQLDRVQGAAHFEVAEEKGLQIMQELQRRLPGYAVPRYVKEIPERPYKTPITSSLLS